MAFLAARPISSGTNGDFWPPATGAGMVGARGGLVVVAVSGREVAVGGGAGGGHAGLARAAGRAFQENIPLCSVVKISNE